jgi:hypothetical protein
VLHPVLPPRSHSKSTPHRVRLMARSIRIRYSMVPVSHAQSLRTCNHCHSLTHSLALNLSTHVPTRLLSLALPQVKKPSESLDNFQMASMSTRSCMNFERHWTMRPRSLATHSPTPSLIDTLSIPMSMTISMVHPQEPRHPLRHMPLIRALAHRHNLLLPLLLCLSLATWTIPPMIGVTNTTTSHTTNGPMSTSQHRRYDRNSIEQQQLRPHPIPLPLSMMNSMTWHRPTTVRHRIRSRAPASH